MPGKLQNIFYCRVLIGRREGNHPLMVLGQLIQPAALNGLDHDASLFGQTDNLTRRTGQFPLGDHQFFQIPAGFNRFPDGIAACQQVNLRDIF